MSNVRGPLLRARFESSSGERPRIGVGNGPAGNAAPDRDAPDARHEPAAPCELPAPTDQGRLYNPPHPIFAIGFVYLVSTALLWGALSGSGDAVSRLAVTFVGLCVCLAATVHWIDGVELAHVPAKLGVSRAPGRAWRVGMLAALPGLAWVGRAVYSGSETSGEAPGVELRSWSLALRLITLLAAAAWYEGFYRGFVFRSLMRRHPFVTSAAASALLLSTATIIVAGSPLVQGRALQAAALEVPLSMALCALFWMHDQALGPAFIVRLTILAAAWTSGSVWPGIIATLVLLIFVRAAYASPSESKTA